MPKQAAKVEFNTFIKGLVTEASPLNFPENASLDEENFELHRNGTRTRRLGIDFEDSYVAQATGTEFTNLLENPPSTFKWMNVGGDSSKNMLVVQSGFFVRFYDMAIEPLSAQTPISIALGLFPPTVRFSFATVDGRLIITAGVDVFAVVSISGGVVNSTYERLLTRDVWGVEVTNIPGYETDVAFRSSAESDYHTYNLRNQSWGIPRKDKDNNLVDPKVLYKTDLSVNPSNSEAVWVALQFQAGDTPFERIYTNLFTETLGSKLTTAKGYFIIDVLRRGQSRYSQYNNNVTKYPQIGPLTGTLRSDFTPGGPSVVCEFAGRAFFGGFGGEVVGGDSHSPNLANFIFFSQLVKSKPDINKCYQEGDPTSRESNEVVDTDGGFIRVAGMDKLISMVSMGTHIIAIASNGVWSIQGGSDYGFTATNFKVSRISTFGGISSSSVIEFSGKVAYWGSEGIFVIGKNQYGDLEVQSMTESVIQTFYDSISKISKKNAVGTYDPITKKLRWIYKSGEAFTSTSVQSELTFDLTIGAFSKNRIYNASNNRVEVVSLFSSIDFKQDGNEEAVLADTDAVESDGEAVVVPQTIPSTSLQATRYLALVFDPVAPYLIFSHYRDVGFRDWRSVDSIGVDAKAFMLTGAITGGDSSVAKQTPYITMQFYRTEEGVDINFVPLKQSSCMIRSQWDWANSANSNKWGPLWEAYRYRRPYLATSGADPYDTGFELVTSKTKLRGRGKAFSLYMETSPNKDCQIVGWNLNINGNQDV